MNYIKLFENYFKDKKVLMDQINDIHYKISDIQLSLKDKLIDDLADVSDIPSVKLYPLITLQDDIALNPEDGLETEYPDNEFYVEIRFKFDYTLKVFKTLRSFEKMYKSEYDIFYTFSPNIDCKVDNKLYKLRHDNSNNIAFIRQKNINDIINNFFKDFKERFDGKVNDDILEIEITNHYSGSNLIITLTEK